MQSVGTRQTTLFKHLIFHDHEQCKLLCSPNAHHEQQLWTTSLVQVTSHNNCIFIAGVMRNTYAFYRFSLCLWLTEKDMNKYITYVDWNRAPGPIYPEPMNVPQSQSSPEQIYIGANQPQSKSTPEQSTQSRSTQNPFTPEQIYPRANLPRSQSTLDQIYPRAIYPEQIYP